jgi:hypothetical protein
MEKRKERSAATIRRARRKLINKLFGARQLDLFVDRSEVAARALVELEAGLTKFESELQQLKRVLSSR